MCTCWGFTNRTAETPLREATLDNSPQLHALNVEKLQTYIKTLEKKNNTLCDRSSEMFTKLCYQNQLMECRYEVSAASHLPADLRHKSNLLSYQ